MTALVVGGDGNVDVLGGGVRVAEGDDGDVDVGSLLDGLGVGARVGDDDQAGLLEGAGDVVGEVTGGETTGNGASTGVGGELQDGTLTVGTGRDDTDCAVLARLVCGLHCFCCCCCVRARWRLAHLAMADAQAALAQLGCDLGEIGGADHRHGQGFQNALATRLAIQKTKKR